MEHFLEHSWADFVRGISCPEREDMVLHLANGCNECAGAYDSWNRVQTVALRESNYTPPEDAVRMARLAFETSPAKTDVLEMLATLVFDTFAQPALAGARSAGAAARQLVYEADGLAVDLRFDGPPPTKKVYLTGQVLDKRAPQESLHNAAVILWSERGLPIAETKANANGEFNLELEPQDNMRLSIQVEGRALIRIPLAIMQPGHGLDFKTDRRSN